MALLALLSGLSHLHHWRLMVWHGDHGWHAGSAVIAKELKDWCVTRQQIITISQAQKASTRNEASARQWRYAELQQLANAHPCDVVTGHTASDRAETLLLQMARGCDLNGLGSLRPQRPLDQNHTDGPQLRRPLLSFSRADTLSICTELKLPIWLDPSNDDRRFARNRIRKEVLPVLESLHPGSSRRIANMAERLSHVQDTQDELAQITLTTLAQDDGLNRRSLNALSEATRQTILHYWLQNNGVPSSNASLISELSYQLSFGSSAGMRTLQGGWTLKWNTKIVRLHAQGSEF